MALQPTPALLAEVGPVSRSVVSESLRPHGLQHARLPCLITNSQSSLKLMSIESVMPFNHLILCHPLLLLPSIFPSIRVFSNESVLCIRWPKYWSFSFSLQYTLGADKYYLIALTWGTKKSQIHRVRKYIGRCQGLGNRRWAEGMGTVCNGDRVSV